MGEFDSVGKNPWSGLDSEPGTTEDIEARVLEKAKALGKKGVPTTEPGPGGMRRNSYGNFPMPAKGFCCFPGCPSKAKDSNKLEALAALNPRFSDYETPVRERLCDKHYTPWLPYYEEMAGLGFICNKNSCVAVFHNYFVPNYKRRRRLPEDRISA